MKQVTMESVKERIARIESGAKATKITGIGLSLQHEFELACLRELVAVTEQRDAVVAENVSLTSAHASAVAVILNPKNKGTIHLDTTLIMPFETPATDAAIAALRAEGVEMFAQWAKEKIEFFSTQNIDADIYRHAICAANIFTAKEAEKS